MAKRNPAQRLALSAKLRAARGNMGTGRELSASENPKTKLARAAGKISAGSTQGLGPSGFTGGRGGSGVAAPVSTLAGLPQSALLQTLIKNGLITEGMPAEQALAVLKFAQMREGVPIDIAELMKQVSADYAKTSGDILTSGQDWLDKLMGTASPSAGLDYRGGKYYDANGNVIGTGVTEDSPFVPLPGGDYRNGIYYNAEGVPVASARVEDDPLMPIANGDPNAGLFYQDPIFSEYAGGMAQLDEVSDANEATDLAWFRKQQASQEAYYNDMMNAISTGTLPVGAAAAGGGGGGGGGGRRGGYGGGGGSGDGGLGFGDVKVTADTKATTTNDRDDSFYWQNPGFHQTMVDWASTQSPLIYDEVLSMLNQYPDPIDFNREFEKKMIELDEETEAYRDIEGPGDILGTNEVWAANQGPEFKKLLDQYEQLTGLRLGDDPNQPGSQNFYVPDDPTTEVVETQQMLAPGSLEAEQAQELRSFIDPVLSDIVANQPFNPTMGDPQAATNVLNTFSYLRDAAQNRIGNTGATRIQDALKGISQGGSSGTPYDSGRAIPAANVMADMSDEQLAQILPQQVGQQVPGSAIGHPPPLDMGQFDEAQQAGTTLPPNRQQLLEILGQSNPAEYEAEFGGPDFAPSTPEFASRQEAQLAEGIPNASIEPGNGTRGINFEGGGGGQIATGISNAAFGPIMQAIAQMRLPQENTPEPPDTDALLAALTNSETLTDIQKANRARIQGDLEELTGGTSYDEWAAQPGSNITTPEVVGTAYRDRLLMDPATRMLADIAMEAMKGRSRAALAAAYPGFSRDELAAENVGGEFYQTLDPDMNTPEEYQHAVDLANSIPGIQRESDMWNKYRNLTQIFSRLNIGNTETQSLGAKASSYDPDAAALTELPDPNNMGNDLQPIDLPPELQPNYTPENPDTTFTMGLGSLGAGVKGSKNAGLGDLLTRNAIAMNVPETVAAPATSWGGNKTPAYKATNKPSRTKTNLNIAKAAQAVKGASAIALALKKLRNA